MPKATQQLKDEHEGIKLMFQILDKLCEKLKTHGELNTDHLGDILEFFKVFVDKCHHGKEEDLLFPAMAQAGIPRHGGPIGVMLAEHEMGRGYVRLIQAALERYTSGDKTASDAIIDNAKGYIALMLGHIDKEDHVLYPMGDQRFSKEKDKALFEGFEKIEEARIGLGKHEEFHRLMHNLKEIYKI
jgi:hemerythrin-like domain-containing protein